MSEKSCIFAPNLQVMSKRFIHFFNLFLGIISLTLAGCHTSKNVGPKTPPKPMLKYGVPPAEIRAKYGVPSPEAEPQLQDTVPEQKIDSVPRVICLYGVPSMLKDE